jgi:hypothetical protein
MKTIAALSAVLLAAAATCAHADPASLRNGKWEVTYKGTEDGKQFERSFESCNRRAASEIVMLNVMSEKGTCTRKALSHTDSSIEVEIDCAAPHASKAVFKYEIEDGTQVKSSTDEQSADGGKKHIEASAHWVGSCAHAG